MTLIVVMDLMIIYMIFAILGFVMSFSELSKKKCSIFYWTQGIWLLLVAIPVFFTAVYFVKLNEFLKKKYFKKGKLS